MSAIESQKAWLNKEGIDAHFDKIIKKVIEEQPKDPLGVFEILSRQVKEEVLKAEGQQPADNTAGVRADPPPAEDATGATAKDLEGFVKKMRELDKVPADEGGEPMGVCEMPDFVQDADALSWAGVGFGDLESYRIKCSLRNLAAKEAAAAYTTLRFWGKILGTQSDYYVAEGKREETDTPEEEGIGMDPAGKGANQAAYYVTQDLAGEWLRLPDVRPKNVVQARKIRRLITGDPDAKVVTHPNFEGTEKELLRAQIARITADTVLCVAGFAKDPPEEGEEEEEEPGEFVCPMPSELLAKKSWTHAQPYILRSGRTVHPEIEEPEEGNDEQNARVEAETKEKEADPQRKVYRPITDDGLSWSIQQAGDTAVYRHPTDPTKTVSSAITYVRCLSWPGAVCVCRGGNFVNVYVGYGLQAGEPDFFPAAPPDVQEEPEDPGEQEEPQGEEPEEPVSGGD